MGRNANSRFALNPTNIDISRSTFDRSSSLKTSFNVGELIPFYVDEVLPGDTFNVKTSKVVRLQTLITPIMDNLYLDTYYFYVPNRLVWNHWKQFNGENTESAWIPQTEYTVPQIEAPKDGWNVGTIADYFGIPTGVDNISISALPFRAYSLIVNEWFRDQNLLDPLNIPVDDTTVTGSNGDNYITDVVLGGKPFIASKYHDYFTSCLPAPQKGPDVGVGLSGDVPVFGNGKPLALNLLNYEEEGSGVSQSYVLDSALGAVQYGLSGSSYRFGVNPDYLGKDFSSWPESSESDPISSSNLESRGVYYSPTSEQLGSAVENSGLIANLGASTVISINSLRMAFQIQKLYERDSRSGSRYIEVLKSHFGVTSPDSRLQRPEYLGGNRIPINVNQVVQNSETANTPQGNVAGYSLTTDYHNDFTRSFTEHGFIIGLCVARYDHTYQQGIERFWSRKDRFDYYWPVLANIGEQAVLNKEIYVQGSDVVDADGKSVDDQVFGYQEAWADYRYKPSRVTGEMRSGISNSLDVWHLADYYESSPYLSAEWISETMSNVNRVLAVSSDVSNQLFGDFYIQNRTTRPMPMYSIPGLIDHH